MSKELLENILNNADELSAFKAAINEKIADSLEIRKIEIASDIMSEQNDDLMNSFLASMKKRGINATPMNRQQLIAKTQETLAARAANKPAKPEISPEEKAKLLARKKELEGQFDPEYQRSDDPSVFNKHSRIAAELGDIHKMLGESNAMDVNKLITGHPAFQPAKQKPRATTSGLTNPERRKAIRNKLLNMAEAKSATTPKTAKEKSLAALAEPKNKITHKDVLKGRGVIDEGKIRQVAYAAKAIASGMKASAKAGVISTKRDVRGGITKDAEFEANRRIATKRKKGITALGAKLSKKTGRVGTASGIASAADSAVSSSFAGARQLASGLKKPGIKSVARAVQSAVKTVKRVAMAEESESEMEVPSIKIRSAYTKMYGKMYNKLTGKKGAQRLASEAAYSHVGKMFGAAALKGLKDYHEDNKEERIDEMTPPGKESVVKALKKKFAAGGLTKSEKAKAYAIAWSQYNKEK